MNPTDRYFFGIENIGQTAYEVEFHDSIPGFSKEHGIIGSNQKIELDFYKEGIKESTTKYLSYKNIYGQFFLVPFQFVMERSRQFLVIEIQDPIYKDVLKK